MQPKSLILPALIILIFSCKKEPVIYPGAGLDDWTSETHSSAASPDYETVFPGDKVNSLDIVITPGDWTVMQEDLKNRMEQPVKDDSNPVYVPCQVFFNNTQWYDVGIRYKGNSSLNSVYRDSIGKLPLRLEFDHFDDENECIKGQTFFGFSQLSLGNNFRDISYIHEKVAVEVYSEFGVPAARSAFYRVNIDFGEGPVYFGLYTVNEVVFDGPMLLREFGSKSGNCYKPEGDGARFNNRQLIDILTFENKTNPDATLDDIFAMSDALLSETRVSDPEQWRAELEAIFSVELFLKWLAANTTMENWDTYGLMAHNFYLYYDPSAMTLTWIPWDNNETFLHDARCLDYAFSNLENPNPGPDGTPTWPLIRYLYDDPVYREKYDHYLSEFISTVFTLEAMADKFLYYHMLIKDYVTGEEGESEKYTLITDPSLFENSVNILNEHVNIKRNLALSYLEQGK